MPGRQTGTITLSELMGDVRKVDVKWMEHEFWVRYKPSGITPAMYAKTKKSALDGDTVWGSESIKIALKAILIEWSIMDDQGIMIPITEENMDGMPNDMLHLIYDTCWDDLHPKEKVASQQNGSLSSAQV